LAPFGYGKLFLQLHQNRKAKLQIKAYTIEFDKKFFLVHIQLKLPKIHKKK
jgi:hypothetical protein